MGSNLEGMQDLSMRSWCCLLEALKPVDSGTRSSHPEASSQCLEAGSQCSEASSQCPEASGWLVWAHGEVGDWMRLWSQSLDARSQWLIRRSWRLDLALELVVSRAQWRGWRVCVCCSVWRHGSFHTSPSFYPQAILYSLQSFLMGIARLWMHKKYCMLPKYLW